jgi:putative endonuclease
MEKKNLGELGEDIALRHLLSKEYQLLSKNWRFKHKEIDLVMKDKENLVIVEVKTRKTNLHESQDEMIPRKKQQFLIAAADAFIMKHDINEETRFDVIIIHFDRNKPVINHIKDAFHPSLL